MSKPKCRDCSNLDDIGAIYKESEAGVNVDYFICKCCLDINIHYHNLRFRSGWTHLYGDISSHQHQWMHNVRSITSDTVCGVAGYTTLNSTALVDEYKL